MRQNVSNLDLAVLGATGATGRHVVRIAADRGHTVAAVVRRPGAFAGMERVREVVWSDLHDVPALTRAIGGSRAVISALGGAAKGPTTVCTDGTRSAVAAMRDAGLRRLVAVSAHGVGDSRDRSLYSLAVWAGVADRMRDKETMEPIITGSGLDWTIVRPPALTDAATTGRYRVATGMPVRLWSSIGRADLAAFLVREAEESAFVRSFPRIAR